MKTLAQYFTEQVLLESPLAKDVKRIDDIIKKSDGDESKAVKLAKTMTKLIKNVDKAKRRWEAAVQQLGAEHAVTKVFKSALVAESITESEDKTAERIYKQSLKEPFWKEISKEFPDYNDPRSDDNGEAVNWLYGKIKDWWPLDGIDFYKKELKDKIRAGIT